jgi:hypothetical protein
MVYTSFCSDFLLALFDLIAPLLTDVFSKLGKWLHKRALAHLLGAPDFILLKYLVKKVDQH